VSWPRESFEALRQIVLIDERISSLTNSVKDLAQTCKDLDSRLIRLEARFELVERVAGRGRRSLLTRTDK